MNGLGDLLRERGNEVAREAGLPMRLTGIGSMVGFQFSGEQSAVLKDASYFFLLGKGMMIGRRGFVSLNLVHERGHIEKLLDGIREFVRVVYQGEWGIHTSHNRYSPSRCSLMRSTQP
jgi:glutamate-1-semialdehyde 2,1-aminomutase